jgi:hypothetical protein
VKDSDILGEPITGVRYNDRTYTFYPYAGRMVSPKGGLLGFIKTANGKLHGRFYQQGQWFMFEPAPEGNEPFLSHFTVGEDVTAKSVVDRIIEDEDDVDPTTYLMSLRRKRDVVKQLIQKYAVKHTWQDPNRLAITFPKDVRFGIALHNHGVAPANTIGISGGVKNTRMLYLWNEGDLDTLINPEPPGSLYPI